MTFTSLFYYILCLCFFGLVAAFIAFFLLQRKKEDAQKQLRHLANQPTCVYDKYVPQAVHKMHWQGGSLANSITAILEPERLQLFSQPTLNKLYSWSVTWITVCEFCHESEVFNSLIVELRDIEVLLRQLSFAQLGQIGTFIVATIPLVIDFAK